MAEYRVIQIMEKILLLVMSDKLPGGIWCRDRCAWNNERNRTVAITDTELYAVTGTEKSSGYIRALLQVEVVNGNSGCF